ncbi:MAG: hypothetical protein KGI67_08145 [Pseudomonadota bacterium]|nr:hypothetical protein [Pseudomonadota bacterium]
MSSRKTLKTIVPAEKFPSICARADAEGMTVSSYLRYLIDRDVEWQGLSEILRSVRAALQKSQERESSGGGPDTEPTLQEILQLVRLVASQLNPQAAARVAAAINQQYPERVK